jgi:hypothetical protein
MAQYQNSINFQFGPKDVELCTGGTCASLNAGSDVEANTGGMERAPEDLWHAEHPIWGQSGCSKFRMTTRFPREPETLQPYSRDSLPGSDVMGQAFTAPC